MNGSRQLTTAETTSQLRVHKRPEILLGSTALNGLDFTPQNLLGVCCRDSPAPE
jgi:hypothetical protein